MKKDKAEIIEQIEASAKIRYAATLSGDYKANNKEGPKIRRIFKMFEKDEAFAMACISELLESKNVVVRTDAAAFCLALRQNIPLAEKVLEEISDDPTNGIFGFNAEMTLKVWRENGELNIYQKKKETR